MFEWIEADACDLPFADATFDRVLCIEAMFHFASRRRFFREAARVLRPGGVLVISDLNLGRPAAGSGIAGVLHRGHAPRRVRPLAGAVGRRGRWPRARQRGGPLLHAVPRRDGSRLARATASPFRLTSATGAIRANRRSALA